MKKVFALLLAVIMCLFAGCAQSTVTNEADDEWVSIVDTKDQKESDTKSEDDNTSTDEKESKEESDDSTQSGTNIDSYWISLIGKSVADVESMRGAMSESEWVDGPIYRFGTGDEWFMFSEYDFAEDNSYIPLGHCSGIMLSLSKLLAGDGPLTYTDLENALGKVLNQSFDPMYETNIFTASYKSYEIKMYVGSKEAINESTIVEVWERKL